MEKERKGVWGFTVKVLNEAGGALVDLYELGESAVDMVGCKIKKAPGLKKKTRGTLKPKGTSPKRSEDHAIEDKIKEKESKIEGLYREIGKEGVSHTEAGAPLDTETVKGLISDVKEYEKEIARLKGRIAELDAQKDESAVESLKPDQKIAFAEAPGETKEPELPLHAAMAAAIETGLRSGSFEFASEKAKFEKVAADLLETEMEIKILAVAELGKMKNKAALPVLAEAAGFEDPNLTLEIVNALIDIADSSAVKLFKDQAQNPHYRVRVACLRGLYKLAAGNDDESTQILIHAMQDEHPDVRKSGATFMGWKGSEDAVPALVQGLKDEDGKVIKAAMSALSAIRDKSAVLPLIKVLKNEDLELKKRALDTIKMITGEEIVFDLQAGGEELDKATDELIDWWQRTRMGETEIDQDLAFPDDDQHAPEAEETRETVDIEETVTQEEPGEPASTDETPKETEEEPEEEPEADTLIKKELIKKLKSELIAICKDLGIDCDEKLTKAEITDLIVERNT